MVSFVVFGHVWFLAVVLRSMLMQSIARPLVDGLCGSVVFGCGLALDADADADAGDCASTCSLWTAKKICSLHHFVLCSLSSPLGATFTNGENDHV